MDNKESNNKVNKEIDDNDNSLINKNENKDFLDSNSDSKIMTELKKIDNKEQLNNDLSKSLSEINRNNSEEDKKTISLIYKITVDNRLAKLYNIAILF